MLTRETGPTDKNYRDQTQVFCKYESGRKWSQRPCVGGLNKGTPGPGLSLSNGSGVRTLSILCRQGSTQSGEDEQLFLLIISHDVGIVQANDDLRIIYEQEGGFLKISFKWNVP